METGFESHYLKELASLEANNLGFRGRNFFLCALQIDMPAPCSFLEIGCRTGFTIVGVAQQLFGADLAGSNYLEEGLPFAWGRLPQVAFTQIDARAIPHESEFDSIGAFDVIEHIETGDLLLAQIYEALKPGGFMVITVPQFPWLCSVVDGYACHVRRYVARELYRKVAQSGFDIVRRTFFVTTFMPTMYLSRIF